jgi:hypothetical protein
MMDAVEAFPSTLPGSLLQKVSALTLAITISTSGIDGWGSAGSASVVVEGADACQQPPPFATATAAAPHGEQASLTQASHELAVTRRLLAILEDDLEAHSSAYLDRLEQIFVFADSHRNSLSQVAGTIAAHLAAARAVLLEEVSSAKQWTRLARVMDPHGRLVLPGRFLQPAVRPTTTVTMDELAAASWVRALDV